METCQRCKKQIEEGHYLIEQMEYYCMQCFDRMYTQTEQGLMYDTEEQYFTSFDD